MWKTISGASYYQVSNEGQVRSLDKPFMRTLRGIKYPSIIKGRILKQKDIRGYKNVCIIYDDGTKRTKQVHRLVMETFHPIDNMEQFQVNHKDCDKANNYDWNLEWMTCKENISHAIQNGLRINHKVALGSDNGMSKLTETDVIEILRLIKQGLRNPEIAVLYGVKENTISGIRTGKQWKHIDRNSI